MHVSLHYVVIVRLQILQITSQKYASSLTTGFWLHNVRPHLAFLPFVELGLELRVLRRQKPGLGEKLIEFGKLFLHFHEISAQIVLSG